MEESEDLCPVRVEMAKARRSAAGGGGVERRAMPVRRTARLGLRGVRLGVWFGWEVHYIPSKHDQNHRIDDRRP
jgi:hypothetical protein